MEYEPAVSQGHCSPCLCRASPSTPVCGGATRGWAWQGNSCSIRVGTAKWHQGLHHKPFVFVHLLPVLHQLGQNPIQCPLEVKDAVGALGELLVDLRRRGEVGTSCSESQGCSSGWGCSSPSAALSSPRPHPPQPGPCCLQERPRA